MEEMDGHPLRGERWASWVKASPLRDTLSLYALASERSSAQIIHSYSTSFGLATRLLGVRHRRHVRNIYALVRIADELVDGVAAEAGLCPEMQMAALDALEAETERAMLTGFSSNPIVYAFASTARRAHFGAELTRPFFASMRTDLESPSDRTSALNARGVQLRRFSEPELADYLYGSAEVVGLMCLRVFIRDEVFSIETSRSLERGARSLGAAFQNVNFLRDLGDDFARLGRSYLTPEQVLSPEQHQKVIEVVRDQLAIAEETLPLLPRDARVAVGCALQLFRRLTDRLAQTPTELLYVQRIRVPATEKAMVVIQSMAGFLGPRKT